MDKFDAVEKFKYELVDKFLRLCNYNDSNKLNLEKIYDTVNDIYGKCINDMIEEDERNDAKVTTSKFLQLRDKLNDAIKNNKGYDNNTMRAHGTSEVTCNIYELQKAFEELCVLLHELIIKENNT